MGDLNDAQLRAMIDMHERMTQAAEQGVSISDALSLWATWRLVCDHIDTDPGLMWWMLLAHEESPLRNPAEH